MKVDDFTIREVAVGHLNNVAAQLQDLNPTGQDHNLTFALKQINQLIDNYGGDSYDSIAVLPVGDRINIDNIVQWALRLIANTKVDA